MKKPALFFPIALAVGVTTLLPRPVRAQDFREEGPREIDKCQTIDKPGSYKLVRNLTLTIPTVGQGTCLSITASFVTIDLAGFSISVADAAVASGISAMPPSGGRLVGITVRNGSILGPHPFGPSISLGLDLGSADASVVEGLHVDGLGFAGIVAEGIVKGNTVTGTSERNAIGIEATGVVTGNFVTGNRNGMRIGQGSTVIGNTVVNNFAPPEGFGLSVVCPSNVTDNTAVNNSGGNLVLNGEGCNSTNNVAP